MSSTVNVFVLSPDTRSERRYDLHLKVGQLKTKLEPVTGIPVGSQVLALYNSEEEASASGKAVASLDDDERPLGYYAIRDWQVIKVSDSSPQGTSLVGQFTDVSQVEKFEISDQEYAQRRDTVRAYKERNKMGRFAESSEKKEHLDTSTSESLPDITIGARCEVDDSSDSGGLLKRGVIRFVGPTSFGTGSGVWVGVEYDEPVGKNDGSVQGKRYFTCRASYGGFVRPEKVHVGDYPPVELNLDEDEEM